MAENERIYTIPLRREFIRAPNYMKTERAVRAIRNFLSKHMKVRKEAVKIGKHLNNKIWEHGRKNPPAKVKVLAIKNSEGIVSVELLEIIEKQKAADAASEPAAKKEKKEKEPVKDAKGAEKEEKEKTGSDNQE